MLCLFVESSCVGAAHTAEAARALGYEPIFLTDRSFSQGDTRAQILRYSYRDCQTSSVAAMVSAARLVGPVAAVTSFSDTCLINASQLARTLEARGLDPAVERLKDKWEVYELIPDHSPQTCVFTLPDIPVDALTEMLARHGTVIVKGRKNSGGQGSVVLRSPADVPGLAAALAAAPIPAHLGPDQFMAQAFIDGTLVSLEGYVSQGTPTFLGFSGRHKIGMSESRILFPYDDSIPERARERAYRALRDLFTRAGMRRGYFHVELMVASDDAYVIDANVGRVGGGGLGQQIAIAHGIPPEEVHAHALGLSIGHEVAAPAAYRDGPQTKTISVMYGIPVDAEFQSVTLPPGLPGYHTTILDTPQRVPAMGIDNYSWIAIASGPDGPLQDWLANVVIHTSQGEFPPSH